jgi:hypothetical protein
MEPPTSSLARFFYRFQRGEKMERADLLYSGLMFAAGMLSLWTALLLTAAFVVLLPSLRKSASTAATILSRRSHLIAHGAKESTPSHSISEAPPQRAVLGRAVRFIQ